MHMHLTEYKVT